VLSVQDEGNKGIRIGGGELFVRWVVWQVTVHLRAFAERLALRISWRILFSCLI
jgi:hypothetical protein